MMEKSKSIFNNVMPNKIYKKSMKSKKKFIKKFGDDSQKEYHLKAEDTPVIGECFGVKNLKLSDSKLDGLKEKPIVIGNIRMGFGHYRISMAMASAARSMGYTPYWLDLCTVGKATGSQLIAAQNDLYSMGSRLSQRFSLFNKLVWEPMNSEGFRKLSYNAVDQKNSELMVPILHDLPKDIPYIATHVWPAQAAVHAGFTHVVNAIPDNWPMALHLAEGSIHTVQTHSSFIGYKALRGMDKKRDLHPMPAGSLYYTGHYIDHEIVQSIEKNCNERLARMEKKAPRRYLLTIGGAGAQKELFAAILHTLIPLVKKKEAVVFVNMGDHKNVWEELRKELPELASVANEHFDHYEETKHFINSTYEEEPTGVHAFYHKDIFAAVYSTNLLMMASDVLVTKPSELAFYPVPKLMIKRVGGHEAWGAIHSAEMGDGTYECESVRETVQMIHLLQKDDEVLRHMCEVIMEQNEAGLYNGAYEAVRLAVGEEK